MKKDLRQLRKQYEKAGWTVAYTGGGHFAFYGPNGEGPIFTPSTPSGGCRSIENIRAKLKRAAKEGLGNENGMELLRNNPSP